MPGHMEQGTPRRSQLGRPAWSPPVAETSLQNVLLGRVPVFLPNEIRGALSAVGRGLIVCQNYLGCYCASTVSSLGFTVAGLPTSTLNFRPSKV